MMTFRRNALGVLTKQATPEEIEAWSRIRESERRRLFERMEDDRIPLIGAGTMKKAVRYEE